MKTKKEKPQALADLKERFNEFNEWLAKEIEKWGNQSDIALKAGVHPSQISRFIDGSVRRINWEDMFAILYVLTGTPNFIITKEASEALDTLRLIKSILSKIN